MGGGYIGVEMAEALARRQVAVTVVDQAPGP
jgi:NADPH-dependent 2,4-dienoyl-CoA reductase/sulfur reductase-like enzyme